MNFLSSFFHSVLCLRLTHIAKQSCNTFIITKLYNLPFHEYAFVQFERTIQGAALKVLVQIF